MNSFRPKCAVSGVDIADFGLTRGGNAVSLAGLNVTQVNASQYTLDLSSVTGSEGAYVLTLVATGSGIQDAATNLLAGSVSDSWTMDATAPTADIVTVRAAAR